MKLLCKLKKELQVLRERRPPPNASIIDNPVNPDFGLQTSDSWIRTVISWSLGHTPDLHKIPAKSVSNFFDNPVNADFGLMDPDGDLDHHQN